MVGKKRFAVGGSGDTGPIVVAARQQAGGGGGSVRTGVEMFEPGSARGQSIEIRSLDVSIPVEREITPAHVVCEDDENVGPVRFLIREKAGA